MASPQAFYPLPTTASLQNAYIGAKLDHVLTPAAILDRAIVRRNCTAMLQVSAKLGVTFRAHVKSHKVRERSTHPTQSGPALRPDLRRAYIIVPFPRVV